MNESFDSNLQEVEELFKSIVNFLNDNNKTLTRTKYFISLGTKTFLEVIEDTFNDMDVNIDEKKEHLVLIESFIEKVKNLHSVLSLSDGSESIEIKEKIERLSKSFGFTGDTIVSNLEITIKNLKKEILS